MEAAFFETHYKEYCRQIEGLDFSTVKDTLGIETQGQKAFVPFMGETYVVSGSGIADASGKRPSYGVCVILSKYLLLCPQTPVADEAWATLKDFHKMSQFTNLNVFTSDAERPITNHFAGRLDALLEASLKLGGKQSEFNATYDVSMAFRALPKIDLLLLFNDSDDEFPAACSVLFQRQAEAYLDPESLIMTGIALAQRLMQTSD